MSEIDKDAIIALAGEYVLGVLDAADRLRAEALLNESEAFQQAVAAWRRDLTALDETAAPIAPDRALWARIAAATQRRQAIVEQVEASGWLARLWGNLAFWRGLGLAGAFASLVLAIGLAALVSRQVVAPSHVAVLETGDGRPAAVVHAFADGTVELIPLETIAVPDGRILEVWTLQTRERGPVSVGRMDQARRLKLNLRDLARPDRGHLFEITLEPPGGSPTGKPTGPVLMKGLAAQSL
jgi:anti-sigma-K factor RskA